MSAAPVLAVLAAPEVDEGLQAFVRLCVGHVAAGAALDLVEVGCGRGLLSAAQDLPAQVERHLEGLAGFDIRPRPVDAAALRDLLVTSDRLLRAASAQRRGAPSLVVIDAPWLLHASDDVLVAAFEQAGQVVKA